MSEPGKDISINKGNLYISVTVVVSLLAGMFWVGFLYGHYDQRMDNMESRIEANKQEIATFTKDIKELLKGCQ